MYLPMAGTPIAVPYPLLVNSWPVKPSGKSTFCGQLIKSNQYCWWLSLLLWSFMVIYGHLRSFTVIYGHLWSFNLSELRPSNSICCSCCTAPCHSRPFSQAESVALNVTTPRERSQCEDVEVSCWNAVCHMPLFSLDSVKDGAKELQPSWGYDQPTGIAIGTLSEPS